MELFTLFLAVHIVVTVALMFYVIARFSWNWEWVKVLLSIYIVNFGFMIGTRLAGV